MREQCGFKCCITVKQISNYARSVSLCNFFLSNISLKLSYEIVLNFILARTHSMHTYISIYIETHIKRTKVLLYRCIY